MQYATKQATYQEYHRASILAMTLPFIETEVRRGSNADEIVRVLRLNIASLRAKGIPCPDVDVNRVVKDYVYEAISIVTGLGISEVRKRF